MSSLEALIPVIGKLQDVFATLGHRSNEIELPQIIVVGSQSAGKSSVIEGIVGRDFLPRGSGLVTRCPLLIHLHHTPANSPKRLTQEVDNKCVGGKGKRHKVEEVVASDWAEFNHASGKLFTDFDEVRKEIEAQTDKLSGTNKGITKSPIILHIYSENVVNLSLVDLPGTVKNPIGDQPHDIELQVRNMIFSYIENPKSIILAVTPANQDFATSEPLQLARHVDAEGDRTLGVLTKLDLMDQGTDAMDVLTNKLLPVKLGIIGVVNRSQKDINSNKSIENCRSDEATFLKKAYPSIASKNGIPFLAKTLNKLLIRHIKTCLPALKSEIASHKSRYAAAMTTYGAPVIDKGRTLLQIINDFTIAYKAALHGNPNNTDEICGGARISHVFYVVFAHTIDSIYAMDGLTTVEILNAIKNASGIRPSILVAETAFDLLVNKQMERFQEPMLDCIDVIHNELSRIIRNCGAEMQQELERFPLLRNRIINVVHGILEKRVALTKTFVQEYVQVQHSSINTKHPEFREATARLLQRKSDDAEVSFDNDDVDDFKEDDHVEIAYDIKSLLLSEDALTNALDKMNLKKLCHDEKRDARLIEQLIPAYFAIVQEQVKDLVPKAIMNFLVKYLSKNLHNELVRALYNPQNVDQLMAEDVEVEEKRKDASEMLEALKKAMLVLSEINEAHV